MQQTKTVKLKTNGAGGVSLAPSAMSLGYHKQSGAFMVAIEQVPAGLPAATVLTAYRRAAIDAYFDGSYTVLWDDLASARPGRIVRANSGRAAQRLIVAGGSERGAEYIPRRRF